MHILREELRMCAGRSICEVLHVDQEEDTHTHTAVNISHPKLCGLHLLVNVAKQKQVAVFRAKGKEKPRNNNRSR